MKKVLLALIIVLALSSALIGCNVVISIDSVVLNQPENHTFAIGEFDYSCYSFGVDYSDGTHADIPLTESYLSDYDKMMLITPGTHTISVVYENNRVSFDVTITIKKIENEEDVKPHLLLDGNTSLSTVYDGKIHYLSVGGDLPEGSSVSYLFGQSFQNAGVYQVKAVITADNYETLVLENLVKIERARFDLSGLKISCDYGTDGDENPKSSFEYDERSHFAYLNGDVPIGLSYKYYIGDPAVAIDFYKEGNSATDAGIYNIIALFEVDETIAPNYIIPAEGLYVSGSLVIDKKLIKEDFVEKIKFKDPGDCYYIKGRNYTVEIANTEIFPDGFSVSYVYDDGPKKGKEFISESEVGTYKVRAVITNSNMKNYAIDNSLDNLVYELVIKKADIPNTDKISIGFTDAPVTSRTTMTYAAKEMAVQAYNMPLGLNCLGLYVAPADYDPTIPDSEFVNDSKVTKITGLLDAGTYEVYALFKPQDENFNDVPRVSKALTINPITWTSATYGTFNSENVTDYDGVTFRAIYSDDVGITITYDGVVQGEGVENANLPAGVTISKSYTDTKGDSVEGLPTDVTSVGTYNIKVTLTFNSANYVGLPEGGIIEMTKTLVIDQRYYDAKENVKISDDVYLSPDPEKVPNVYYDNTDKRHLATHVSNTPDWVTEVCYFSEKKSVDENGKFLGAIAYDKAFLVSQGNHYFQYECTFTTGALDESGNFIKVTTYSKVFNLYIIGRPFREGTDFTIGNIKDFTYDGNQSTIPMVKFSKVTGTGNYSVSDYVRAEITYYYSGPYETEASEVVEDSLIRIDKSGNVWKSDSETYDKYLANSKRAGKHEYYIVIYDETNNFEPYHVNKIVNTVSQYNILKDGDDVSELFTIVQGEAKVTPKATITGGGMLPYSDTFEFISSYIGKISTIGGSDYWSFSYIPVEVEYNAQKMSISYNASNLVVGDSPLEQTFKKLISNLDVYYMIRESNEYVALNGSPKDAHTYYAVISFGSTIVQSDAQNYVLDGDAGVIFEIIINPANIADDSGKPLITIFSNGEYMDDDNWSSSTLNFNPNIGDWGSVIKTGMNLQKAAGQSSIQFNTFSTATDFTYTSKGVYLGLLSKDSLSLSDLDKGIIDDLKSCRILVCSLGAKDELTIFKEKADDGSKLTIDKLDNAIKNVGSYVIFFFPSNFTINKCSCFPIKISITSVNIAKISNPYLYEDVDGQMEGISTPMTNKTGTSDTFSIGLETPMLSNSPNRTYVEAYNNAPMYTYEATCSDARVRLDFFKDYYDTYTDCAELKRAGSYVILNIDSSGKLVFDPSGDRHLGGDYAELFKQDDGYYKSTVAGKYYVFVDLTHKEETDSGTKSFNNITLAGETRFVVKVVINAVDVSAKDAIVVYNSDSKKISNDGIDTRLYIDEASKSTYPLRLSEQAAYPSVKNIDGIADMTSFKGVPVIYNIVGDYNGTLYTAHMFSDIASLSKEMPDYLADVSVKIDYYDCEMKDGGRTVGAIRRKSYETLTLSELFGETDDLFIHDSKYTSTGFYYFFVTVLDDNITLDGSKQFVYIFTLKGLQCDVKNYNFTCYEKTYNLLTNLPVSMELVNGSGNYEYDYYWVVGKAAANAETGCKGFVNLKAKTLSLGENALGFQELPYTTEVKKDGTVYHSGITIEMSEESFGGFTFEYGVDLFYSDTGKAYFKEGDSMYPTHPEYYIFASRPRFDINVSVSEFAYSNNLYAQDADTFVDEYIKYYNENHSYYPFFAGDCPDYVQSIITTKYKVTEEKKGPNKVFTVTMTIEYTADYKSAVDMAERAGVLSYGQGNIEICYRDEYGYYKYQILSKTDTFTHNFKVTVYQI